jgi:chemotaxis protein methyltransferase CheR
MMQAIADSMLEEVSRRIAEQMGLHFPRSKWRSLERAFCTAARELGFPGTQECLDWFVAAPVAPEFIEAVAGYLTVGETYFLRESRSLEILAEEIIPELARKRQGSARRLRIWSAGCSTGEEPYSIAITLQRLHPFLRDWDISILASDINPVALEKALRGGYTEWSFRNPPRWLKENYFEKNADGRYEIIPRIRKMVNFTRLNLVKDIYPSLLNGTNAMDVIFCRNVLMYFTPEQARQVIDRLHLCLVDGGVLFVSPCETSQPLSLRFTPVNFSDAILYRKQEKGSGGPEKPRGAAPARVGRGAVKSGQLSSQPLPSAVHATVSLAEPRPLPAVPRAKVRPSPTPAPAPSLYEEALRLYEQGAYAAAAERLALQLSRSHNDVQSLALMCRIRANEGQLEEALRLSGEAIAADKLNADLYYLRGGILQEQGAAAEAAASLKQALYLNQELVLAHFSLGNLALRQGKTAESRRHFDNALALLQKYQPGEIVPESGGIVAARLMEIIGATVARAHHHPEKSHHEACTAADSKRFLP